jgi:hypothetical protein
MYVVDKYWIKLLFHIYLVGMVPLIGEMSYLIVITSHMMIFNIILLVTINF